MVEEDEGYENTDAKGLGALCLLQSAQPPVMPAGREPRGDNHHALGNIRGSFRGTSSLASGGMLQGRQGAVWCAAGSEEGGPSTVGETSAGLVPAGVGGAIRSGIRAGGGKVSAEGWQDDKEEEEDEEAETFGCVSS